MKALVTGGAGFIGSNLIEELLNKNYEVVCLDINKDGYWNDEAENYVGDVCDLSVTSSAMEGVDYVFHMAADVQIGKCIENPIHCYQNNVLGTAVALEAAKSNNVKKFVLSSTSAIYKSGWKIYPEDSPEELLNPYSASKKCCEDMCEVYSKLYELHTVSLRYFNVYGPRQHTKGQYAPVLGIFQRQRDDNKPLTIMGDGSQTRDFIHVGDVAKANITAAEKNEEHGIVYNVGTGTTYTVQEIADIICPIQTYIDERQGEVKHSCASINKIKYKLGWKPSIDLKDWILHHEKQNTQR